MKEAATATATPDPIMLQDMTVLKLEPGDIVVLKHPRTLSGQAVERLLAGWARILETAGLTGKVSIVVHEEAMEVGILRGGQP